MFCYLTKERALNTKKGFLGASGILGMFFINGLTFSTIITNSGKFDLAAHGRPF